MLTIKYFLTVSRWIFVFWGTSCDSKLSALHSSTLDLLTNDKYNESLHAELSPIAVAWEHFSHPLLKMSPTHSPGSYYQILKLENIWRPCLPLLVSNNKTVFRCWTSILSGQATVNWTVFILDDWLLMEWPWLRKSSWCHTVHCSPLSNHCHKAQLTRSPGSMPSKQIPIILFSSSSRLPGWFVKTAWWSREPVQNHSQPCETRHMTNLECHTKTRHSKSA